MPTITTSDGVRLSYLDGGDPAGAPVVLVAGFRAPATSWKLQQGPLAEAGYRVLSLDRRSHGASEDPPAGHTMARHGEDLGEFLTALGLRDTVLVGGSMGASTIWSYVTGAGTGRVRGAVSVDQTPKMLNTDDWAYGFYGYTESNRETYFAQGIPKTGHSPKRSTKTTVRMMSALSRSPLDLVRANQFSPTQLALLHDHAVADWRDVVVSFDVPMLMVAARDSDYWPYEHATSCAQRGPNVRAAVIDHCGHAANIEQPETFNRILLDFIRSL
jgi:pimeloyl-ACP methyl ester carboxylesterase